MQWHTQAHFPSAVFVFISTPEPLFYPSFIKQEFIGSRVDARHILDPGDRVVIETDKNLYPRGGYSVAGSRGQQGDRGELQIEGSIGASLAYRGTRVGVELP